jgi:glucosyl-dolichyl phosphate glucuronosyltransferase
VQITVILCTYNRCRYLRSALESISSSVLPDFVEWEVLVVDNNSSDDTPHLVKEFASRYPGHFRYVFEPRQGKSHALNVGVRESRGDLLAFVDDDVTVGPNWMGNLTHSLERGEWAGVGGRTLLAETVSPPRWLALTGPHSLAGVLAAQFDLGDKPRELDRAPFGANMAFHKEMFNKYGLFRTDLGPSTDRSIPRPNEDTEFGRRLLAAGERLLYEPSAVVYHPVLKERIRKDYFLSWWFDYGRASIREAGRRPNIWGIQRRYWSITKIACALLPLSVLRWVGTINPASRFFFKCWVWVQLGQISEVYKLWGKTETQSS